ncbi:MAG: diacylglycerol kinase family protein [Chloroflexi bacterium]|nr:MAG: diacylglycerol kinase family protein [Chloroflexota bacterium]
MLRQRKNNHFSDIRKAGRDELYSRARSFRYAFEGWWYVIRTQHNAWIHAIISVAVFAVGFWVSLPARDWAVLILTMMAVWMAEFMNTALEAVVDLTMPDVHPLAKVAKDVAAAAVLVGAMGAVLIGLLILGPPLYARLWG